MRLTFTLRNEHVAELEVDVEPWCFKYYVQRGSSLVFHYEASAGSDPRGEVELRRPDWMAVWFDSSGPPDVEIDGKPVEPMWR